MVSSLSNYLGNLLRRARNQRGMALLATMMAIALMTIIVVDFTSASSLGYLSAANNANEIRATYLARSAVSVGLALLAQDTRAQMLQAQSGQGTSGTGGTTGGGTGLTGQMGQTTQQGSSATTGQGQPFDSFASVWAIPFPPMPVNGGTIGLAVVDEARKFNLNKLINQPGVTTPITGAANGPAPATNQPVPTPTSSPGAAPSANGANVVGLPNPIAVNQFTNLLIMLGMDTAIVPAVLDWMDPDSIEMPQGGAEADFYRRLLPPYQPRNGPMPTIGDLRLVRGIDDAVFAKLRNYVTVASETGVNPNTAPPEVLACLDDQLTKNPDIVKSIIQQRSIRPFATVTELMNQVPAAAAVTTLTSNLTLRSQYFSISGVGSYAGARKLVSATFRRNPDGTGILNSWQED